MGDMKELIDEVLVERAMFALLFVGPLAGLAGGALWSALRRQRLAFGAGRGLALGLLGPLVTGLWHGYSYLVRFEPASDPSHDYFGLERVDVLLVNIVLFALVGWAVGSLIRKVRERDACAARPDGVVAGGDAVVE